MKFRWEFQHKGWGPKTWRLYLEGVDENGHIHCVKDGIDLYAIDQEHPCWSTVCHLMYETHCLVEVVPWTPIRVNPAVFAIHGSKVLERVQAETIECKVYDLAAPGWVWMHIPGDAAL